MILVWGPLTVESTEKEMSNNETRWDFSFHCSSLVERGIGLNRRWVSRPSIQFYLLSTKNNGRNLIMDDPIVAFIPGSSRPWVSSEHHYFTRWPWERNQEFRTLLIIARARAQRKYGLVLEWMARSRLNSREKGTWRLLLAIHYKSIIARARYGH